MKAVVIGGKGKVANYLIPMLVKQGYDIISVSRGKTAYFNDAPELQSVTDVYLDRNSDNFEKEVAKLGADVIVDMICFSPDKMLKLIREIGNIKHYVVCGSLWYHGASDLVPVREDDCRNPWGEYGVNKLAMSDAIIRLWKEEGFHGTIVHPGHIVAPGQNVINPQGNFNQKIFEDIRNGKEILIPNFGLETVHHVHAADVAGVMNAAIKAGEVSFGEDFHAASSAAVSLAGYTREVSSWFGKEANIKFLPFDEFAKSVPERDAAATLEHISRSPAASMEKTKEKLGYVPGSTFDAIREHLTKIGMLK